MQNAIRRCLELIALANVICCVRGVSTSYRYAPYIWALYKHDRADCVTSARLDSVAMSPEPESPVSCTLT